MPFDGDADYNDDDNNDDDLTSALHELGCCNSPPVSTDSQRKKWIVSNGAPTLISAPRECDRRRRYSDPIRFIFSPSFRTPVRCQGGDQYCTCFPINVGKIFSFC